MVFALLQCNERRFQLPKREPFHNGSQSIYLAHVQTAIEREIGTGRVATFV